MTTLAHALALCECGCGEPPSIARRSNKQWGHVKGHPVRFIQGHHNRVNVRRGERHPNWKGGRVVTDRYVYLLAPNHPNSNGQGYVREHVAMAAKALGRAVPKGVEVHHDNGNQADNRPENLVVCQDRAYHAYLHQRMCARAASGHADWRKCVICKGYDAVENLYVSPGNRVYHRFCKARYAKERAAK